MQTLRPLPPVTDREVIATMAKCGGSFVQALAAAMVVADPVNLQTLKAAFPGYWETYTLATAFRKQPVVMEAA